MNCGREYIGGVEGGLQLNRFIETKSEKVAAFSVSYK